MKNDNYFKNTRKALSATLVFFMSFSPFQPFSSYATVTDGAPGNVITWANSNYVNLTNSGAYTVGFSLSGTLNPGDTFSVNATDGSGHTAMGTFLSASGWESTGSVVLNFSTGAFIEWNLVFSGVVYTGSILSQVVASGMTLTGILDRISPTILLSSTAPSAISGAISVNTQVSEAATGLTLGDITVTNGTATGFLQTGSVSYTFIATPTSSSGTMAISIGTGTFTDLAGNQNMAGSNSLSYTLTGGTGGTDTTPPSVTITSHVNNAIVSGFPTLTGAVSDTGWVARVIVNGFLATIGSGTWSKTIFDLTPGPNTVNVIATDLSGNTGSTSILLNRVSFPLNTNVALSGTTTATVTFATDLSDTGVIAYGTNSGSLSLSATGTLFGTWHNIPLSGLVADTVYYFSVRGQGGTPSIIMHFKTPTILNMSSASWSITATSSVYLSGATSSGATFANSGSIRILSLTANGSSIVIPLNGLIITASGGNWDGVIQAPEVTSNAINLSISGSTFIGTPYQIGNPYTELTFSGQPVTVTINKNASFSGQFMKIYRSTDGGATYSQLSTCTVSPIGDCIFTTNQLSLFALATSAPVVISGTFSFNDKTNAELSTTYESNAVTVTGIANPTRISIVGGEYKINGWSYTWSIGSINSGDVVTVRAVSSASFSTRTSAVLTIGWISDTFLVTTKAAPTSSGGGSGSSGSGGGGGGIARLDNCPNGDFSPSYYDGTCGVPSSVATTTVTQTGNTVTVTTNSGGVITMRTFNIPGIILHSLADVNFTDIGNNWAELYILRMVIRGIVNNAEVYRPDDNLTRAEFLKIVINATGWNIPTSGLNIPFDDVPANLWYTPYVSLALSEGMISSLNTSFRPNDSITRAEATKILITALWVNVSEPSTLTFFDLDPTSDLTKYVETAKTLGILSGQLIDGQLRFRPNDPITRAEIAKIVVNAFHL